MGKNLIIQARGKGGPRYRTPSHRFLGRVEYLPVGNFTARVLDILNDPGHYTPLMLIKGQDGKKILQVAPEGIQTGDFIHYGEYAGIGSVVELSKIPIGTKVSCIETQQGSGPKFCRSSGTFAFVTNANDNRVTVKFSSGKEKILDGRCRAMVGIPAGGGRLEKPWIKAGKKVHAMLTRGKLFPRSAGVSMTPTDHPYGGRKKAAKNKAISRHASPGRKVGSISARRTGKRK
ncbi:MAG: 50S ribosomal protein L2 [Candidatus Aenigmarchaeota archaeon]|nr:50S ribosomal protein L2 [Candidatus Aenigmarchaeota archaeon]